eukprot:tig00021350_g20621.t1
MQAGVLPKLFLRPLNLRIYALINDYHILTRYLSTPVPFPYVQMLQITLFLYFLVLPFVFTPLLGSNTKIQWQLPLILGVFTLVFYGIKNLTLELEVPFGSLDNHLPLETLSGEVELDLLLMLHSLHQPALGATPLAPARKPRRLRGAAAKALRILRSRVADAAEAAPAASDPEAAGDAKAAHQAEAEETPAGGHEDEEDEEDEEEEEEGEEGAERAEAAVGAPEVTLVERAGLSALASASEGEEGAGAARSALSLLGPGSPVEATSPAEAASPLGGYRSVRRRRRAGSAGGSVAFSEEGAEGSGPGSGVSSKRVSVQLDAPPARKAAFALKLPVGDQIVDASERIAALTARLETKRGSQPVHLS